MDLLIIVRLISVVVLLAVAARSGAVFSANLAQTGPSMEEIEDRIHEILDANLQDTIDTKVDEKVNSAIEEIKSHCKHHRSKCDNSKPETSKCQISNCQCDARFEEHLCTMEARNETLLQTLRNQMQGDQRRELETLRTDLQEEQRNQVQTLVVQNRALEQELQRYISYLGTFHSQFQDHKKACKDYEQAFSYDVGQIQASLKEMKKERTINLASPANLTSSGRRVSVRDAAAQTDIPSKEHAPKKVHPSSPVPLNTIPNDVPSGNGPQTHRTSNGSYPMPIFSRPPQTPRTPTSLAEGLVPSQPVRSPSTPKSRPSRAEQQTSPRAKEVAPSVQAEHQISALASYVDHLHAPVRSRKPSNQLTQAAPLQTPQNRLPSARRRRAASYEYPLFDSQRRRNLKIPQESPSQPPSRELSQTPSAHPTLTTPSTPPQSERPPQTPPSLLQPTASSKSPPKSTGEVSRPEPVDEDHAPTPAQSKVESSASETQHELTEKDGLSKERTAPSRKIKSDSERAEQAAIAREWFRKLKAGEIPTNYPTRTIPILQDISTETYEDGNDPADINAATSNINNSEHGNSFAVGDLSSDGGDAPDGDFSRASIVMGTPIAEQSHSAPVVVNETTSSQIQEFHAPASSSAQESSSLPMPIEPALSSLNEQESEEEAALRLDPLPESAFDRAIRLAIAEQEAAVPSEAHEALVDPSIIMPDGHLESLTIEDALLYERPEEQSIQPQHELLLPRGEHQHEFEQPRHKPPQPYRELRAELPQSQHELSELRDQVPASPNESLSSSQHKVSQPTTPTVARESALDNDISSALESLYIQSSPSSNQSEDHAEAMIIDSVEPSANGILTTETDDMYGASHVNPDEQYMPSTQSNTDQDILLQDAPNDFDQLLQEQARIDAEQAANSTHHNSNVVPSLDTDMTQHNEEPVAPSITELESDFRMQDAPLQENEPVVDQTHVNVHNANNPDGTQKALQSTNTLPDTTQFPPLNGSFNITLPPSNTPGASQDFGSLPTPPTPGVPPPRLFRVPDIPSQNPGLGLYRGNQTASPTTSTQTRTGQNFTATKFPNRTESSSGLSGSGKSLSNQPASSSTGTGTPVTTTFEIPLTPSRPPGTFLSSRNSSSANSCDERPAGPSTSTGTPVTTTFQVTRAPSNPPGTFLSPRSSGSINSHDERPASSSTGTGTPVTTTFQIPVVPSRASGTFLSQRPSVSGNSRENQPARPGTPARSNTNPPNGRSLNIPVMPANSNNQFAPPTTITPANVSSHPPFPVSNIPTPFSDVASQFPSLARPFSSVPWMDDYDIERAREIIYNAAAAPSQYPRLSSFSNMPILQSALPDTYRRQSDQPTQRHTLITAAAADDDYPLPPGYVEASTLQGGENYFDEEDEESPSNGPRGPASSASVHPMASNEAWEQLQHSEPLQQSIELEEGEIRENNQQNINQAQTPVSGAGFDPAAPPPNYFTDYSTAEPERLIPLPHPDFPYNHPVSHHEYPRAAATPSTIRESSPESYIDGESETEATIRKAAKYTARLNKAADATKAEGEAWAALVEAETQRRKAEKEAKAAEAERASEAANAPDQQTPLGQPAQSEQLQQQTQTPRQGLQGQLGLDGQNLGLGQIPEGYVQEEEVDPEERGRLHRNRERLEERQAILNGNRRNKHLSYKKKRI